MNLALNKITRHCPLVVDATYVSTQVCSYEPDQTLPPMFSQDQKVSMTSSNLHLITQTCENCNVKRVHLLTMISTCQHSAKQSQTDGVDQHH